MLFNSHIFFILFLPITFVVFEYAKPSMRLVILCIASSMFYAFAGIKPFLFMIISVIWVYGITALPERFSVKIRISLAVAVPLLTLFLFRYLDFTISHFEPSQEIRQAFSFFLNVLVPAGISFYTLQLIGYAVDVISGRIPRERSIIKLFTFISFFPQLIAGPIVRYHDVSGQYDHIATLKSPNRDFLGAFKYLSIGLVYKVFLADILSVIHAKFILGDNTSVADALISIFSYSFQIYYDFWGYSMIAIGLGKLFGIELPRNFLTPYVSKNPKEFWRRWHITLSQWLRDYIYLALGGNRKYLRNILIVFAGCGLWHGASWSFIVWGLYHAALVIGYRLTKRWWDVLPSGVQILLCFIFVSFGWPLFYTDFSGYLMLLETVFMPVNWKPFIYGWLDIPYVVMVFFWTFLPAIKFPSFHRFLNWVVSMAPAQAIMIVAAIMSFYATKTFIYFRF
jgi:alginate O-acetyltransferase complex protein AlgI